MEDFNTDEQLIQRFENAWQDAIPNIEDFLPHKSSNAYVSTLFELVVIDLEFRWKRFNSEDPTSLVPDSVEQYLKRFPCLESGEWLNELADEEFGIRQKYKDTPVVDSFIAGIPQHEPKTQELETCFPRNDVRQFNSKNRKNRFPTIARHTLIREIGEGGMGSVYLAQQEAPVRRKVAIKVIRRGMDSKDVIARFEAERQALAIMDHQNISRVLDAGATDQGQPYFAMEFVDGIPITDYCRENKISISHRLELFNDVCAAVQHAHQKGILHRDLKPSNVLIATEDGKPIVKVIDFGLAKAIDNTKLLTDKSVNTHAGQVLGTLKYMSPEQASISEKDVDTRADVYALGVMLYELLTGVTPLDEAHMRKLGILSVLETIRDHEPIRPSMQLNVDEESSTVICTERATTSNALRQLLQGDLDWVVMKALEKDRDRRYDSPNSLADDVRRFLRFEPVVARPPSASYRLQKFARKNRGLVISGLGMLLLLIGGITATTWQAIRATKATRKATRQERIAVEKSIESEERRREADALRIAETAAKEEAVIARDNAEKSEQRALDVLSVVVDSFHAVNPTSGAKKNMLAADVLNFAWEQTEKRLVKDPLAQASLFQALSRSFEGMDDYEKAIEGARKAIAIRKKELGPEHIETTYAMQDLINALNSSGKFPEAMDVANEVLRLRKTAVPVDFELVASAENNLGAIQLSSGNYSDAIASLNRALNLYEANPEFGVDKKLSTASNLAYVYQQSGNARQALLMLEKILPESRKELGVSAPITLSVMSHLGLCYEAVDRLNDAVEMHQEAYERAIDTFGQSHSITLNKMLNLGNALSNAGRAEDAVVLMEENVKLSEMRLGKDHPSVLVSQNNLASAYHELGQSEKSANLNEAVLKARRAKLGDDHPRTLASFNNLVFDYISLERFEKAKALLEEALPICEKKMGKHDPLTRSLLYFLAKTQDNLNVDRADETWELLIERTIPTDDSPLSMMAKLSDRYTAANRIDDSIRLYSKAIESYSPPNGTKSIKCLPLLSTLAELYIDAGRPSESIQRLEELLQDLKTNPEEMESIGYAAYRDLIICRFWVRDFVAAESDCRNLLKWLREMKLTKSARYAITLTSLASALAGQERFNEAIEEANRAIALKKITNFSKAHATVTIATCGSIGIEQIKFADAIDAATSMQNASKKLRRKYQVLMVIAIQRIIKLCEKQNEPEMKKEWLKRELEIPKQWKAFE